MNCPCCERYIVPEFYCINCGHVPPKLPKAHPNGIAGHEIPLGRTGQQATSPAVASLSQKGKLALT